MIYNKLRTLRKQYHYTSKEMGQKLGISKPFYCKLENQTRRLSYEMAIKIATIFHIKPDAIFYEDHPEAKKESSNNH